MRIRESLENKIPPFLFPKNRFSSSDTGIMWRTCFWQRSLAVNVLHSLDKALANSHAIWSQQHIPVMHMTSYDTITCNHIKHVIQLSIEQKVNIIFKIKQQTFKYVIRYQLGFISNILNNLYISCQYRLGNGKQIFISFRLQYFTELGDKQSSNLTAILTGPHRWVSRACNRCWYQLFMCSRAEWLNINVITF